MNEFWPRGHRGLLSLYADGSSCGRRLGPGGWAMVMLLDGHPLATDSGGVPEATNNQMELTAVLNALIATRMALNAGLDVARIELVSDSMYALGMANGSYSPKVNKELVQQTRAAYISVGNSCDALTTRWVPGHKGEAWNERCDSLAKEAKKVFLDLEKKRL